MSADQHSQDDAALEETAQKVAKALGRGRPRSSVAGELVAEGWNETEAMEFVTGIDAALKEQPSKDGGSGAMGWIGWIGILLLINFLSWIFGWSFWIW